MSDNKLVVIGLGSRSTAFYLQALNKEYNAKFGGYSTCPLVLYNVNFHAINTLLPRRFKSVKRRITTIIFSHPNVSNFTCTNS